MNFLTRTELLIGEDALFKLKSSHILIIGLGGVGSYAAEAIARSGIGKMTIVDGDIVQESNINRQLPALYSNIGQQKSSLIATRIKDINPEIELIEVNKFLMPEDMESLLLCGYTYVLDCIDSIAPKIEIITFCKRNKIKFISAMGAGGKINPKNIQIADISETKDCYFSRDLRKRLRKMDYNYGIKVVYSDEYVDKSAMEHTEMGTMFKRSFYGTISYMPAMFGMTMASYVIRKIIEK